MEDELTPFFQALEEYADGWMPEVIKGKRYRKYDRAALWKSFEERREGNSTELGLYRTTWPAVDSLFLLWLPPRAPELDLFLKVKPLSFFAEAERCRLVVEMVRAWASRYPVSHATAHSSDDMELSGFPKFGRDRETFSRDGFDQVYEVCWLNVFGPKLVELVGRERMLSTPAWRVEELPNGGVLLVTRPTAADFASDEARLAQARAHCHLRPDLDFDTVLGTLRARSATLAPVEPHFPADLVPLPSLVVDHTASHERSRLIAQLNAWQPPEPEEWLPADCAPLSDVRDVKHTLAEYDTLAELLVALLHSDVPSVFGATPESLTDIDFYFWREDFPSTRPRESLDARLAPAVGAYLGEVLVRHLGGRWIPRREFQQSQVLVGNRVWLPFARASRCLCSRQSLLDFSLTSFFRSASRHRG